MAQNIEVAQFLRAGEQRLTAAEILYREQVYLDSMYLAGYAVECSMKAFVLGNVPRGKRKKFERDYFRGATSHNFEYLRGLSKEQGIDFPFLVEEGLRRISSWSTDLRYETTRKSSKEAKHYLDAARNILEWSRRSV